VPKESLPDLDQHLMSASLMDTEDPLGWLVAEFDRPRGSGAVYLDGNSLGPPSKAWRRGLESALEDWSEKLVRGWQGWMDLAERSGDNLGGLIGAAAGQVAVCDNTTVNLYKLAAAVIESAKGREEILVGADEFPTDRYVLEGLAASQGVRLVKLGSPGGGPPTEEEWAEAISERTALACVSAVHYRSGRRVDMAQVNRAAADRGAVVVWDLSHAAGAVPVELDATGSKLAVGCTYKYLNAGPGAPGYLYVSRELQDRLRSPIWGWFAQRDQFDMAREFEPAPGIKRMLSGTPPVVNLVALDAAVSLLRRAGPRALWERSKKLTGLLMELADKWLGPLGVTLASPADPSLRGGHVALAHAHAEAWSQALAQQDLVVADYRWPDVLRAAPSPSCTRFEEVVRAVAAMAATMETLVRPSP